MSQVGDLETMLAQAGAGGWDWFDKAQDKIAERIGGGRPDASPLTDEGAEICAAWRAFAQSAGGRKALQDLCNRTVNRAVYLTHMGYSAEQVAIFGAHREGQNDIVHAIMRMIAQDEPDHRQPKPREAENAG